MADPQARGSGDELNFFLVVLDLAEGDVERLTEALESYSVHARLWASAWVIRTAATAGDVLESLDRHLTRADRVFVAAIAGEVGWRNVECDFAWLRENLEGVRPQN